MSASRQKVFSAGFTLVELAIVMIIIGLLITGVLKGQQLITNAQVTSQVSQIQAIDTATSSFRDQFGDIPGDFVNPSLIVPACTVAPCNLAGDGDQKVDALAVEIDFTAAPAGEQLAYWAQLHASQYLTGLNPGATNLYWGGNFPASRISGGGMDIGWYGGGITLSGLQNISVATSAPRGTYLALHGIPNAIVANTAADSFLTPNLVARIDAKFDDGRPNTGSVAAAGFTAASATGCASTGMETAAYNESVTNAVCSLYIRFQQ